MIAAVDVRNKAVWGVGTNREAALDDARHWIAEKPHFRVAVHRLQFFKLNLTADQVDHHDGLTLFEHVVFDSADQPGQMSLFDRRAPGDNRKGA